MLRIMLIDDDPIFNMLSTLQIRKIMPDAEVSSFTSAPEAIQFLTDHVQSPQSLPDYIFLDIRMPQMDGFGFLAALRDLNNPTLNAIDVIMLTSSMYDSDKETAASFESVKHFLEKPLTAEKFGGLNLGGSLKKNLIRVKSEILVQHRTRA